MHNLSLKRGSVLTESHYEPLNLKDAEKMIDYSVSALTDAGYEPYYMYRQKYNTGNLENSGYAKPGTECVYNVDIMEENCNILAAGAGAISKRLFREEKPHRASCRRQRRERIYRTRRNFKGKTRKIFGKKVGVFRFT
ncbi:MAG: hypothetical protein L6V85_06785 [Clostridiales bacterium]|nr:MAG: hypothetical protein L6V85_06785 [Clostridiales bacterium]